MDIGFDVDVLPRPGETALAASMHSTPGGKGANQAVAAARAGAEVQFVGAVGDDPAAVRLREHLETNGVGTDGLITIPGRSGNAVVVVDSGGENIIVVAPEANGRLTVDPVDTSGAGDVFAGVLAAGWTEDREQALRRACAAGALATLVSGAGDCAPYAGAIDNATLRG